MAEIPKKYIDQDDSDDDDESLEKKSKAEQDNKSKEKVSEEKKNDIAAEIAKLIKEIEEDSKHSPEIDADSIDSNPELETEAPVEHLSEVEIADISRSLAVERLDDIDTSEMDVEDEAASRFLEEVVNTGDIEAAESEIITTPFVGPEKDINIYKPEAEGIDSGQITIDHTTKAEKAKKAPSVFEDVKIPDIWEFLSRRRENRIESDKDRKKVNKKLGEEVDKLRLKLVESERRVRVEANNVVEKNSEDIPKNEKQLLEHLGFRNEDEERKIEKPVQLMNKSELLKVAEKIKIEETSLKKIFENQLITEKGLRRIISTFLRGGNVKRALNREIMERQIDFERDPLMRDADNGMSGGGITERAQDEKKSKVEELLQQKGINFNNQDLGFIPKNSIPEHKNNKIKKTRKKTSPLLDLIMALLLLGLFTALLILLYKK